MKRFLDISLSLIGLIALAPLFLLFMLLIWLRDFSSPFYVALRAGKDGKLFHMFKFRSMVANADKAGINSTAADDKRITRIGQFIRKYKIDEFSQLWNVLRGHMSLVGPRPNIPEEVSLYTEVEKHLLDVKPGITDFSSIVFSDEGEILMGSRDPDLKYNRLIRPWKSRLGLFYINHHSFIVDLRIIWLTFVAIISRKRALRGVSRLLESLGADQQLLKIAQRQSALQPYPPPGAATIVTGHDN